MCVCKGDRYRVLLCRQAKIYVSPDARARMWPYALRLTAMAVEECERAMPDKTGYMQCVPDGGTMACLLQRPLRKEG